MGGLLHRRGGEGLNVTVDATHVDAAVHRPRSLRESRRVSPYGRAPSNEALRRKLPPLHLAPLQLAPTLPTPGTQLSNAIGGLALAPIDGGCISARTRSRATKAAWARLPTAKPPAAQQHAARQHATGLARSPAWAPAQTSVGGSVEFDAYLLLHGFTTERTPPRAVGPSFAPPLEFVALPNLVPQPPLPEARVPAKVAAVRVTRGKRRLRAETITVDEEHQHEADQAQMCQMIKMLRQFDAAPPPPRKPPPTSDLAPTELAELRARMVAALGEACRHEQAARVRATSLGRHQLSRFLALLAPRRKQQPGDEWMLDRLWAATDLSKDGRLSEDELLQGLGGAFSRSLATRLRWNWQTFFDVALHGELSAHAIFGVLEQVPVGSRLEDDALLLCRLASTKLTYGQRAAVTMAEYIAHYADAAEDEPDALGLRRRRPQQRVSAEAVRARARGLLHAQQLLQAANAGGAGHSNGSSTARAAASTAAASREIPARAAATSMVYTSVSKTL